MRGLFSTGFTVLVNLEFCLHINLVPFGDVVLRFTLGTD